MKIIILAGGGGTRLWPWSRQRYPKQLQALLGKDSMLARTYKRVRQLAPPEDILVATGKQYVASVARQLKTLPKENILAEPVRKDTAGGIGLAAARVYAENPEEIMLCFYSDAWVDNDKRFAAFARRMAQTVKKHPDHTVLAGIRPTYPETGYGYINVGKKIVQQKNYSVFMVRAFTEKPNLARAKKFIKQKTYYWNPGWFAWRADHLMSLYKKHLKKNYAILKKISAAPKSKLRQVIDREFPKLTAIPIDYGILEKTKKILMPLAEIGWSDIGHWRSVAEMSHKDKLGNVVDGASLLLDSADNLFISSSGKCITSIGIKNTILVETEDVILLVDKHRAQDVRALVKLLSTKKHLKKLL